MRIKRPIRSRLPLDGIIDHGALGKLPGINTEISQTAHIGIGHNLEDQRTQRSIIIRRQFNDIFGVIGVGAFTAGTSSGEGR